MTAPAPRPDLAAQFRRDGCLVIKGLFDPAEVLALRAAVIALEESVVAQHLSNDDNTWRDGRLWTMYALIDRLGVPFRALVGHPWLLRVVEDILGPGFSWMCRSPVTVKRDGDGVPITWHRDWQDVPEGMDPALFHAQPHLIACTIPLDSYSEQSCFWAFPGSHRISLDEAYAQVAHKRDPFLTEGAIPLIVEPGDLIIHDYWVMHGSPAVLPGMPGRRGLIHAYWSKALAEFTQHRFPQYDLRNQDRHRVLATCIEERQRSPWNRGQPAFRPTVSAAPFPAGTSLRTPHWHYAYYAADATRDLIDQ